VHVLLRGDTVSTTRVDFYDNAMPGNAYRVTCRITHVPTGIVVQSDEHQTLFMARTQAFERLLAKIDEVNDEP